MSLSHLKRCSVCRITMPPSEFVTVGEKRLCPACARRSHGRARAHRDLPTKLPPKLLLLAKFVIKDWSLSLLLIVVGLITLSPIICIENRPFTGVTILWCLLRGLIAVVLASPYLLPKVAIIQILMSRGVILGATVDSVTRKTIIGPGDPSHMRMYHVSYWWEVDGSLFNASKSTSQSIQVGEVLPVLVDPNNPDLHMFF